MSIFSKNPKTKVGTNVFDLTHDRKFSGKMGNLMPMFVMDLVPGDKVDVTPNLFVRFAPLVAPVMHQVTAYVHMFFVPNRLLWNKWEDFMTGGRTGNLAPTWPFLSYRFDPSTPSDYMKIGSLSDYLGLPVAGSPHQNAHRFSAFPHAAYQLIYDEFYRDQNLIAPVIPESDTILNDGNNNGRINHLGPLRKRAWQHDYFTSALPWTQRGPSAMLPLGGEADIVFDKNELNSQRIVNQSGNVVSNEVGYFGTGVGSPTKWIPEDGPPQLGALDLGSSHYADLSTATATTIEELRRAVKLQEYLEKMARGGARYTEYLETIFGVTTQDYRLQRPEYVGGYTAPIKVSEVLQNAPPTNDVPTPQGNMAGHAVGVGAGRMSYYAHEHGYLMGIVSVMPRSAYQQGIPKHFLRQDKFEYFTPDFAHIGEQPVFQKEVYLDENPDDVFGYTPRYSEYKFMNGSVHGDFRHTLDFWHMGRKFSSSPSLNQDFIEMDHNEVSRIFAVKGDEDHLWMQVINQVQARRKMPYFGNPKF